MPPHPSHQRPENIICEVSHLDSPYQSQHSRQTEKNSPHVCSRKWPISNSWNLDRWRLKA